MLNLLYSEDSEIIVRINLDQLDESESEEIRRNYEDNAAQTFDDKVSSESESSINDFYINIKELNSERSQDSQPCDPVDDSNISNPNSLKQFLLNVISAKLEKQKKIDDGLIVKKGIGRTRINEVVPSSVVISNIREHFIKSFIVLCQNRFNTYRSDACKTMFQRKIRKTALKIMLRVAVRNKYKSHAIREYSHSFVEAFTVFSLIFMKQDPDKHALERFLEFCCIYFPIAKVKRIADDLLIEKSLTKQVYDKIILLLKLRDKTSIKSLKQTIKINKCIEPIIKFCKEVFKSTKRIKLNNFRNYLYNN